MSYKDNKEIMDLIKHIKDINGQMSNTDEQIRKVIGDVQKTLPKESITYEISSANGDMSKMTTIDNIDINVLRNKLPFYKALCETELLKKCGQKLFDEICCEENL